MSNENTLNKVGKPSAMSELVDNLAVPQNSTTPDVYHNANPSPGTTPNKVSNVLSFYTYIFICSNRMYEI